MTDDIRRVNHSTEQLMKLQPNAGLIYDKYMKSFEVRDKSEVITQTKRYCVASPAYRAYFTRWHESVKRTSNMHIRTYETQGRLIVGIGNASVRDIGISLNHTYGVPYLPGSSLKGVVSSYVLGMKDTNWGADSYNFQNMFGTQELAGGIDFMDAPWHPPDIPPANQNEPSCLEEDVINPHHQQYYNPTSNASPDDFEGPVPIFFVTVKQKQRFVVAIHGEKAWADIAFSVLTKALSERGIGAKTRAGYGRMQCVE